MAALIFNAEDPHRQYRAENRETLRDRLALLPDPMRKARRWLLWTPDKVPHYTTGNRRNGKLDGPEDVARFASLDDALGVIERSKDFFAGVGFALGFDATLNLYWQGLDLDHAMKGSAFTNAQARDWYGCSTGYAEKSPSGAGLHVIGLGPQFLSLKWKRAGEQAVEAYSQGRFFTVTGNQLRDGELEDLAPLVESIRAEVGAHAPRADHVRKVAGESNDYLARQSENLRNWLAAHPIEPALSECGFKLMGDRWLSPRSDSGVPGVVILDQLRAVSFHASDAGLGTKINGDGEVFNAFDLAARFQFNDDRTTAMRSVLPPQSIQSDASCDGSTGQSEYRGKPWRAPANVFRDVVAPPFDIDDAPAAIGRMAQAFHEATGFDQSGAIVAGVVAAAAMVDDRYRLAVRAASEWFESARLWCVLIATPSAGKSPIIRAATDPIKSMHTGLFASWFKENGEKKPDKRDPLPCLFTSDATVEALAEQLRDNPRGMLMLTEEFSSWIGGIDAYRDGTGAKNRGEWLQLYDGGPHQIHRIKRGASLVPNWSCSVLAACTPAGLRDQLRKLPDDGLIQRFIPCILGAPTSPTAAGATDSLRNWEILLRRVFNETTSTESTVRLRMDSLAQSTFDREAGAIREGVDALYDVSPPLASHVGKHPGMLARLALVFHVINGRRSELIDSDTMEQAIRFMHKARRHAAALYLGILSTSPGLEIVRGVARAIAADGGQPKTIGRFYMTQHCRAFRNAEDTDRRLVVQTLEDGNWLAPVPGSRAYGGWGASEWNVNPGVFDAFARDGEVHRDRRAAVRELLTGVQNDA